MRIQVISDLHQEFGFMDLRFYEADLIIFAGDINLGVKGIEWIKSTIKYIPVIYVWAIMSEPYNGLIQALLLKLTT